MQKDIWLRKGRGVWRTAQAFTAVTAVPVVLRFWRLCLELGEDGCQREHGSRELGDSRSTPVPEVQAVTVWERQLPLLGPELAAPRPGPCSAVQGSQWVEQGSRHAKPAKLTVLTV
jgi:hypothetical protein